MSLKKKLYNFFKDNKKRIFLLFLKKKNKEKFKKKTLKKD